VNRLPNIQTALQSDDEEIRRKSIQSMRGIPLQNSCDLLFSAMGDESWRIRKEAVELFIASDPEEEMIARLLELLRCEDNAGLRNSAAEAVTRLGARTSNPLINLVNDRDADVRKFVIDVMGSISDPLFVSPMLAALQDPDINVAAAAAEHLGNMGDVGVVQKLLQAIVSKNSDLFRFSALAAIGKLAAPAPVPDAIKQLADHDLLRKAVYDCLGSIANESAMSVLLGGLSVRQQSSRNAALLAIYRLYSRSGSEARQEIESSLRLLRGGETVPMLLASFDAHDASLTEALVVVLDIIGDKRSVDTFLQAFTNERLSRVALRALKNLGTDGIDTLISHYHHHDEDARSAICALIGECVYLSGSLIIRDALNDPSPIVQRAAVSAAGKLGLTDCIPGIVRLLDDSDLEIRNCVVTCLQALSLIDRSGIQAVASQIVESAQPELRRNAAVLFAALGDSDRLSLLAKDEDALVREAAVTSIGKLRFTAGMGTLLIALVDENPDVRIAAADALGTVGDESVIDALNRALADEDSWVQSATLKSIYKIQPEVAIESISGVFSQADGLLLITCLELLDQLGGSRALDLVEETLDNCDSDVVTLSLNILARHAVDRLIAHAECLLAHQNWNIRVSCARAVASLPATQAYNLLSAALEREENDLVRTQMQSLLKGLA
jgi:HEAT repeat protein